MAASTSICVEPAVLSLEHTLPTGQAFRWQQTSQDEWTGVIGKKLFTLTQDKKKLHFQVLNGPASQTDRQVLERYFQLDVNFGELCSQWSEADALFRSSVASLEGVRILRQDPLETLVAFICSSNNNIPRISQMMNRLCATYGQTLGKCAGHTFHSLPSLQSLAAEPVEAKLRELGFGYRAKYVAQAAQYIQSLSGEEWLASLCDCSYEDAWRQLQKVPGVGPKVADCVCLMALNKPQAVPIDTHMLQVAVKHYGVKLHSKSLTQKVYTQIGDLFRARFGHYAGWAQAVMFTREVLVEDSKVALKRKQEQDPTFTCDRTSLEAKKKRQ